MHEASRLWRRLFLVGVWAAAGCAALAQDDGGPVRYELQHIGQNDRLPGLPGVTAAVEVKIWEPDVRKGIELLMDILNEDEEAVDLYDPTDHVFISLENLALDPSGHSVTLPEDHVGIQFARFARDVETRASAITEIKARRPFHIVKDEPRRRASNVKGVDDVEGVENGVVRLNAGEHFQVRLRFTHIMAEPQKYWAEREKPRPTLPREDRSPHPPELIPPHLSKPVPIPAGTYQVSVIIVLTTETSGTSEGESIRRTRIDKPVTVHLGPKPEPGD